MRSSLSPTPSTLTDTAEVLASLELFESVGPSALEDLAAEFGRVHFLRGEDLIHAGGPGDCMYVVLSGRLHAFIETADGQEQLIREMGPGETVGEMALVSGERRSATVRAARDSELLRLSKSGFERIVREHPESLMRITRVVVDRLRKPPLAFQASTIVRTIGLLPAGREAPLEAFAEQLAAALSDVGPVLHLDSRKFDQSLGEGAALDDVDIWDETDSRIAAWLTKQETVYRFVLYEADLDGSAWSRRCIRQADRILLVGNAASSPEWSPPEEVLFEADAGKLATIAELVLLHEERDQVPTGTQRWLRQRPVAKHHHMHLHTRAHIERLVRFLTGRAVGVVLGGGGARGAAHIGVLRALSEAGIPIDMIGGTSAGGMIAAQYAIRLSHEGIRDDFHRSLVASELFKKFTLPIVSLIASAPPSEVARKAYGDIQIEDLWTRFFCVSCNLSTGETMIHQRGPLWKAVRATSSLPGILVPVVDGRHLLIDGGVVDNLPSTIMKRLCGGPVIVVNVSPDSDVMLEEDFEEIPSSWEILWSWLNPFRRAIRIPTIMTLMARVVVINSLFRKEMAKQQADLLLDVPVAEYDLLDFGALDEMVGLGHRYATEQIKAWREAGVLEEALGIQLQAAEK